MIKLWKIAVRDLERNRRRTLLTLLSVVIGVAMLIFISSFYAGVFDGSLKMGIDLQSSHLQLRAPSYDEDKVSLEWKDLVEAPTALTDQIEAIQGVQAATPVLWANGLVLSGEETVGVSVNGIVPQSSIFTPIRQSIVAGEMPAIDDRTGILMGKPLADDLGLSVGESVVVVVNTANQTTDQAEFTIRGLFDTGVVQYDESTLYMPLPKAQTFTAVGDRVSAIRVLLDRREDADAYAATFKSSGLSVLTWRDLNELLLESVNTSVAFMQILNFIVLGIVAVVIANTLLMSVFERTHEIGILTALGMKARQILAMFLLEAGVLGVVGVVLGLLVGGAVVLYFAKEGISFGQDIMQVKASNMITYGRILYTKFAPGQAAHLSLFSLALILLVSLYPARIAARMEPVKALHGD